MSTRHHSPFRNVPPAHGRSANPIDSLSGFSSGTLSPQVPNPVNTRNHAVPTSAPPLRASSMRRGLPALAHRTRTLLISLLDCCIAQIPRFGNGLRRDSSGRSTLRASVPSSRSE
jgi:hypothetical protein